MWNGMAKNKNKQIKTIVWFRNKDFKMGRRSKQTFFFPNKTYRWLTGT